MAGIFRKQWTKTDAKTGRKRRGKTRVWYVKYRDPATRKVVVVPGFTDRLATQRYAVQLETGAARNAVDPGGGHRSTPLAEHVAAFCRILESDGGSPKHVRLMRTRVTAAVDGCGWRTMGDVSAESLKLWLAGRRQGKRFGVVTSNHYLSACRSFTRWLVGHRGLAADPLAGCEPLNAAPGLVHSRRVLTPEEFARLVAAARANPWTHKSGLKGETRARLYTVAAYTGLRAAELAVLTAGSFRGLRGDRPSVVLEAGQDKAKAGAALPLHATAAAAVREQIAAGASGRLFAGSWRVHAARMLRGDLKAAGIPYRDARGRVFDFHSLRAQFITSLARAGVALQKAQKLARHSTPVLTANTYSLLDDADLRDGLDMLPPLGPPLRVVGQESA